MACDVEGIQSGVTQELGFFLGGKLIRTWQTSSG